MAGFKVYDPDQVSISLGTILIDPGAFADGEFLRIEKASDDFLSVVGSGGEVTRSRSNDRRADITFVLMQSASVNAELSILSNLDRASPQGAGVVPLLIRDRSSNTTLFIAEKAWIKKTPDVSFDREATSREWVIEVADLKEFHGGNL